MDYSRLLFGDLDFLLGCLDSIRVLLPSVFIFFQMQWRLCVCGSLCLPLCLRVRVVKIESIWRECF